MNKKIFFVLLLSLFVCYNVGIMAQTSRSMRPDTLVMNEDDLADALKRIALGVQETDNMQNKTETSTNKRLDRLEYMLFDIMLQLGLNPAQSRQTIVLDKAGNVVPPVTFGNGIQYAGANTAEIIRMQKTVEALQSQLTSLTSGMEESELKTKIGSISDQLQRLGNSFSIPLVVPVPQSPSTPAPTIGKQTETAAPDTVVISHPETKRIGQFTRQVFFAVSSSKLTTEARRTLSDVAEMLKNNATLKTNIVGFSSPEGNSETNRKLSEKRAEAVKTFLAGQGVAAERLAVSSAGVDTASDLKSYGRRVDVMCGM